MSHDMGQQPYRVGKGKPPKEHQWKKGQPSPNPRGRPKGSGRETQLQKMLKKKVWVTGTDNRRVRKAVGEVINHKLIETAAKGDFKAIKLINELVIMQERFQLVAQPSAEEVRRQVAEEAEKKGLTDKLHRAMLDMFDFVVELKRYGVVAFHDGRPHVTAWVVDAAADRKPNSGFAIRRRLLKEKKGKEESASPVDKPVEQPGG